MFKKIATSLIRNPLTVWFLWFLRKNYIEIKNRQKHVVIGYLSQARNCKFGKFNTLYENVFLLDVELGDCTYIAGNTRLTNVKIGKYCSIGPNIRCGLGKHPTNEFVSTHPAFFSIMKQAQITFVEKEMFKEQEKILIGNDVWIGANSLILDGVSVGNGAIIGAGSVVTKDVPPYAVVVGVPAKVIKYRFSPEEISFLQGLEWWNKDMDWIKNNCHKFTNIKKFREVKAC